LREIANINNLSTPTSLVLVCKEHPDICEFPFTFTAEVKQWVAQNMKHECSFKWYPLTSFLFEIDFQSERDAALFKLFWL
jgi:hypothetical protein